MLYYENGEYKMMPYKATYRQNGQEYENEVVDKEDLLAFQEMGHIQNVNFFELEATEEQKERLEEVKNYPESEFQSVTEYVLEGKTVPGTLLENNKQRKRLEESILDISLMLVGGE